MESDALTFINVKNTLKPQLFVGVFVFLALTKIVVL